MRTKTLILLTWIVICLAPLVRAQEAADGLKNLPLVFDPSTKKYFIGGNSRLLLKQGDMSGPIERIEISVDGGEFRPYGESIQFTNEGKHSLKFRAINPVNNWSPVQFIEVFSDLTAPTTEAKFSEERYSKDESGLFLGVNSTVTLTAQDNLSGLANIEWAWDYSVDGARGQAPPVSNGSNNGPNFTPYNKPIVIESMGKHALLFRSVDRVGNVERTHRLEFFADGTTPNSKLKMNGADKTVILKNQTYLSDAVNFSIDAVDDASKVKQIWVSIDGKSQIYINPIHFLKEGAHTLSYYAVDKVGNKEPTKTFSFYTVSTPPRTAAKTQGRVVNTGGINYATRDFQLTLEAQENVVGLERIEVKLDQEADFRAYLEPIRFNTTGIHTIYFRSIDRTGNVEPTKTYVLNIHEIPPETAYTTAQPMMARDGITYSPTPNVITFNTGGSPVGVAKTLYSINDGAFNAYTGPITLTADHKVYKIAYKSVDKLGNEEKQKMLTVHMIGTVPVVDLFITNGKSKDEQIRTDYLDKGDGGARQPASKNDN